MRAKNIHMCKSNCIYLLLCRMSPPARTRSISTNSSDSETTSTSGDISENHTQVQSGNKSPRSVGSSPGR